MTKCCCRKLCNKGSTSDPNYVQNILSLFRALHIERQLAFYSWLNDWYVSTILIILTEHWLYIHWRRWHSVTSKAPPEVYKRVPPPTWRVKDHQTSPSYNCSLDTRHASQTRVIITDQGADYHVALLNSEWRLLPSKRYIVSSWRHVVSRIEEVALINNDYSKIHQCRM